MGTQTLVPDEKSTNATITCVLRATNRFRDCFVAVPSALAAFLEKSLPPTGSSTTSAVAEAQLARTLQEHVVPLLLNNQLLVGWHRGRLSRTIATRLRPEVEIASELAACNGLLVRDAAPAVSSTAQTTTAAAAAAAAAPVHRRASVAARPDLPTASPPPGDSRTKPGNRASADASLETVTVQVSVVPRNELEIAERVILEALDEENWQRLHQHREWIERELLRQLRLVQWDQCIPIYLVDQPQPVLVTVRQVRITETVALKQHLLGAAGTHNSLVQGSVRGYWLSLGTELVFVPPGWAAGSATDDDGNASPNAVSHNMKPELRVRVVPAVGAVDGPECLGATGTVHPETLIALGMPRKQLLDTSSNSSSSTKTPAASLVLVWEPADAATDAPGSVVLSVTVDSSVPPFHVRTAYAPPFCWARAHDLCVGTGRDSSAASSIRRYDWGQLPVVYGNQSGKQLVEYLVEALEPVFAAYQSTPPVRFSRLQGRVVLLGGAAGSGKSHVAWAIAMHCSLRCRLQPRPVYIPCRSIFQSGASYHSEGIRQLLDDLIGGMAGRPAVLVLDDLDALLADETGIASAGITNASSGRALGLPNLMEQIAAVLERCTQLANVAIIVTVTMERVGTAAGPLLPGGISGDVLDTRHELPLPSTEQEKSAFAGRVHESEIADLHTPADLLKVALLRSIFKDEAEAVSATGALQPLLGNALVTPTDVAGTDQPVLADLGGLEKAKTVLVDTFVLPLRFPVIYRQAPIRLPAGVLLYGMPGTGKTALVQAAVAEAGLRLVHIKGPELLNKYVGASEASVRALFSKARQQRPCVIFFDEFESLAPKRGGTGERSTGVTDRIVNALLTEMDGVESLDTGVFVVAATCRPDLVDPALLRPGRIDQWIRLDPPAHMSERQAILQRCTRDWFIIDRRTGQPLDDAQREKLLAMLAEQTSGSTGADLAALCSSTLICAEKRMAAEAASGTVLAAATTASTLHVTEQLVVLPEDFTAALSTHRVSLPASERQLYLWAMAQFEGKRATDQAMDHGSRRVMLQ
jgi:AAA+ superfamily predicted ATPase